MKPYNFDDFNRFVVSDYNQSKPFSSFLPGIAGISGKPMWVFYVNRGQGIASFGVQNKNGAMMEFYPANKSYQLVPTQGFRTFIKLGSKIYEPFTQRGLSESWLEKMFISSNLLELEAVNEHLGLSVKVSYFTMPNESFAALVRQVTITNLADEEKSIELLDGLPVILPYGLDNSSYKDMGNTLKSWMDVYNLEEGIPFYKLRASTLDSVEVSEIAGGHFYLSFILNDAKEQIISPIVDSELIFGQDYSFCVPTPFSENSLKDILDQDQITTNKVPCGFSAIEKTVAAKAEIKLFTILGHVSDIQQINKRKQELTSRVYIENKAKEARDIVDQVTDHLATQTSIPLFDAYCKQSYLDNILRGGQPILLGNGETPFVYHIYSRKHGDLERDYNFFSLDPSYYSQGNGNFRDINQNRRNDVWIHPEVKDFNIVMFMSLMQTDGYNPLVIKGCSFKVKRATALLEYVNSPDQEKIEFQLRKPYTPGKLLAYLEDHSISLSITAEQFLIKTLSESEQSFEAEFGEGYWIDHWTYNLDLIESYLAIYPDQKENVLFHNKAYMYFDSPAVVLPRDQKMVLMNDEVKQLGAIAELKDKAELLEHRAERPNWMRTQNGHGEIYQTNLYEKLIALTTIKFATMDPEGMGIEMEANKPGWNDSLNGLPALMASGFSELCELQRLIQFIIDLEPIGSETIELPEELSTLLSDIIHALDYYEKSEKSANFEFMYWDQVSYIRENYRERVKYGFVGTLIMHSKKDIEANLLKMLLKVKDGIQKASVIAEGIYPTYFYYNATEYVKIKDAEGLQKYNDQMLPYVKIKAFLRIDLPLYLEGPTKAMKTLSSKEQRKELYANIKKSGLYDQKLKMYKVNASLEGQPNKIGRAQAFTPGWLENESIFMHMEYKYLLELLKGELYLEFYEEMRSTMVPFMDPEIYGRSTLENSSFIASSANPNSSLHGTGFVARLSGSTAEFLSIWNIIMFGKQPFVMEHKTLALRLKPILPEWLFDHEHKVKARFLGNCDVTYHNPNRGNTFDAQAVSIQRIKVKLPSGEFEHVDGDTLHEPLATMVRSKKIKQIEVYFGQEGLRENATARV